MNRRQAIAGVSAMTASLALTPSRSIAMDSIAFVNAERARELGLQVRSRAAGPDGVWVELEFEPAGKLAGMTHVDLQMHDGKKLLLATILRNNRSGSGHFAVSFTADRCNLGKFTLRVMKDLGLGGVGYVLRVSEFVDLKQLR